MKYTEAKQEFLNTWGRLGSEWGINRTMAQVHALLIISHKPLCTEDIMEELSISRGNTNMNVRELISWELVEKVLVPGDRKEYFRAEQDMWTVAKRIITERKNREIKPLELSLQSMLQHKSDQKDDVLNDKIKAILTIIHRLDKASDALIKLEENVIVKTLLSITKLR